MTAYYNEFDPFAAQWLRNLIAAGHLPKGDVDERSIVDVRPDDLAGFVQCHFFAGIGGWGHALRLAGWPDGREIWTGSCPCQPFSVAGKGRGTDDPRHLWPHFFRLIRSRRPAVVMGEQVAGAAGCGWLDGVVADLEAENYACRGVDIPACAIDAPHIRSRLYWVASDARSCEQRAGLEGAFHGADASSHMPDADIIGEGHGGLQRGRQQRGFGGNPQARDSGHMAHPTHGGWREERADAGRRGAGDSAQGRPAGSGAGRLDDARLERHARHGADGAGWSGAAGSVATSGCGDVADACGAKWGADAEGRHHDSYGPNTRREEEASRYSLDSRTNSTFWSDAVWLTGADGKARRAQPGLPLLAHGIPGRVGRLRAYGNAIVPQLAAEVIAAFMECAP